VTELLSVVVEACAAYNDADKYRAELGRAVTQLCFSVPKGEDLAFVKLALDVLGVRDETLIAGLARARAITRTRLVLKAA